MEDFWWIWNFFVYFKLMGKIVSYVIFVEWKYCYWVVMNNVDFVYCSSSCFRCYCSVNIYIMLLVKCFVYKWCNFCLFAVKYYCWNRYVFWIFLFFWNWWVLVGRCCKFCVWVCIFFIVVFCLWFFKLINVLFWYFFIYVFLLYCFIFF